MGDDGYEGNIDFAKVATLTPSSTLRTMTAQIIGVGAVGDDASAERYDSCEVVQPSGLAAAPTLTADTEALIVRRGDEAIAICVIDKGATAQAVEGGETRLYGVGGSNATSVIRIRANGAIEITAGTSANIVLNGGTLNVARASDGVTPSGLMSTWMAAVATYINTIAPGTIPGVPATIGTITGGNARVKA